MAEGGGGGATMGQLSGEWCGRTQYAGDCLRGRTERVVLARSDWEVKVLSEL